MSVPSAAELIAGLGEYREVELPAGRLRYRERGSGRPLVLLHGGLANGDLWRDVVPRLATDHRCIVPDLPKGSHRLPMRPDADLAPPGMARLVVDFLDALGLDRVTLVTNDSGGAVGQMVAAAHPDRVDRLVLSACDTYGQLPPRYLKPLRLLCLLPGLGQLMSRAWLSPLVYRPFFASIVKHGTPPEVLRSYLEPLREAGIRRDLIKFFRGCAPRHTRAAARGLATFPRPVLILWAEGDLWFARRNARRLAREVPDGELRIVPDCRTFIPEDRPAEFAELVRVFLLRQ